MDWNVDVCVLCVIVGVTKLVPQFNICSTPNLLERAFVRTLQRMLCRSCTLLQITISVQSHDLQLGREKFHCVYVSVYCVRSVGCPEADQCINTALSASGLPALSLLPCNIAHILAAILNN